VADLEEADLALVSEDPWLSAGTLALQWAKEMAESRLVNQGVGKADFRRVLSSFVGFRCVPSRDANRSLCYPVEV
jgi:hypothetical protein